MNITTRRHPRTLQEAFGPYTADRIEAARSESRWHRVMYALAVVAIGLALYFGA